MSSEKLNNRRYLIIVCLAAIFVMLPIPFFGIPSGTDLPQHFQFANTYYDSLTGGDGFPSWSPRENNGYGGMAIRFYPPLAYYAMAFARILIGNWFDAAWTTFAFWMVVSCLGVYFWARRWLPARDSALAAVFYAVFPMHLNQLYIAFIYADFAGAAILPFCFGFLTRVLEREKKSDVLGLAVAYAALILTHLPTTIIGSLGLAVFACFLLKKEIAARQIFRAAVAAGLGLAASAFYWFPMVSEMQWLNHAAEKYSSGHYYFGNRFFPLYFHAIASDFRDNFILSDVIVSLCLLFFATPVVYLFYRRTNQTNDRAAQIFRRVLPLGLLAFLMVTPLSYPIWKIITPLQKIQFPMRWMSLVGMCSAIAAAAAVHFLIKGNFLKQRIWIYLSILFVSTFLLLDFTYILYPSAFVPIPREQFETQIRELPDRENYEFWWTTWSKRAAIHEKEKVLAGSRETIVSDWQPETRSFTTASGEATKVRVATFYYPHWKATVNDQPVNVEMDESGVMLVPILAEKSTVKLFFQEPAAVRIAVIFSIVAWAFIAALLGFCLFENFARLKISTPYPAEEFSS